MVCASTERQSGFIRKSWDDLQEETGSDELAAAVWNNLGACYGRMFLFARAAEAYEKAYNRSGSRECLRAFTGLKSWTAASR